MAVILGRFLGAVLAECAPVLVAILAEAIKRGTTDTAVDSLPDSDLRNALDQRVRDADRLRPGRGPGAPAGDGAGEDLGA